MTISAVDRRASRRFPGQEDRQTDLARVRPGHDVTVVDLSAHGALLETGHRLLPGAWVELQWLRDGRWGEVVRARVLRSHVVDLRADVVGYRGAVMFDDRLSGSPRDRAGMPFSNENLRIHDALGHDLPIPPAEPTVS